MLKKTLLTVAAAAAISGGALALQPAQAQAASGGYVEVGYKSHHNGKKHWRRSHHRRCYVVYKRVRYGWHWGWRPVRICKPHYRRW